MLVPVRRASGPRFVALQSFPGNAWGAGVRWFMHISLFWRDFQPANLKPLYVGRYIEDIAVLLYMHVFWRFGS